MRTLIIDGNHTVYRSVFKLTQLHTSTGIPTGGIFGFLNSLSYLISEGYYKIIVVFDGCKSSRRLSLYQDYKNKEARTDPVDINLSSIIGYSLNQCYEISKLLGIRTIKLNAEGDDVIFNIAKNCGFENTIIYSEDNDFLQMVSLGSQIYQPIKFKYINQENFEAEVGVKPEYFLLYKSILGDSSDNIPGLKGIGPVAALGAISCMKEPTLNNLKTSLQSYTGKLSKKFQLILENFEYIERNLELVDMSKECIDSESLSKELLCNIEPDYIKLTHLLNKYEFGDIKAKIVGQSHLLMEN